MSLSNKNKIRKAKPILGTIVEIALYSASSDESALQTIIQRCFERIRQIHDTMSFFSHESDIGRLNSAPAGTIVDVSHETASLLQFANKLYTESNGAFDVMYQGRASFPHATILLNGQGSASRTEAAPIDLGGIAKGYAVDQAALLVQAEHGVSTVINAGGDIRFIGEDPFPLTLRSPLEDGRYFDAGSYSNCAVATSLFNREHTPVSISVFASTCVVADSLTKCVYGMSEEDSKALLTRYNARALTLDSKTVSRQEGAPQ